MNPHGMRVDRHGNIWVIDSFLNVIYKLNPRGDVLKMIRHARRERRLG